MSLVNLACDPGVEDKVLIAYHAHCIDGYTSAWACWRGLIETTSYISTNIEFMEMKYGSLEKVKEEAHKYKEIYFVDFSLPLEDLEYVAEQAKVVIIDHHKSAIKMYRPPCNVTNVTFCLDVYECGASLVWKYFFPMRCVPVLIQYVRDYDLWQHNLWNTKAVNKYLRLETKSLNNWQRLQDSFEIPEQLNAAMATGKAMLAYHNSIVEELISQAEPCVLDGIEGLCVNCSPQFSSDVGHELALISGTYGATWQQEPRHKVKWSLRSTPDTIDVSELAAKFNGGGHREAAGFYLSGPTEDATQLMGIALWSAK